MRDSMQRQGRVIRRYRKAIRAADFKKWQDRLRGEAKGHGLYALYEDKRLIYVGLATKSIRSRIRYHMRDARGEDSLHSLFSVPRDRFQPSRVEIKNQRS